jgi:hypothetical protein
MSDDLFTNMLLGQSARSRSVRDFLKSMHPVQYPEQVCSEEDYYSTELDYDDLGMQLCFVDAARFNNRMRHFWGDDGVVLERVDFYSNRLGFKQFSGQLPFGLMWGDKSEVVHQKMMMEKPLQCRAYKRLVYSFKTLEACFTFMEGQLSEVTSMARPIALTPVWSCEPPKFNQLLQSLGQPIDQLFNLGQWGKLVKEAFDDHDEDDGHTLDLRYECGIEIYMRKLTPKDVTTPLVEAYKFYRDRELDATEWRGELPFNLNWHTSPAQFREISTDPPLRARDDEFDGYMLWKLEDSEFHIYYSNWINRASRITIGCPGFLC